jgi:RNA polymerase sigma-70 factor, ECF subfamily
MSMSPSGPSPEKPQPGATDPLEAESGVVARLDFTQVYAEHFEFVWRFAAHRGVPEAALDDVVQETFLIVHRQLHGFLGRSTLRTWIAGITRNVLRTYLRKRGNQAVGDPLDDAAEVPSLEPMPLEALEQKSASELLDFILGKMTDTQREAFILCEVEGLSAAETAEALGINENTMRTRLHDARKVFNTVAARLRAQQAWSLR